MTRIAVLVSGGGTNLQALINAWKKKELSGGELQLVISSKAGVRAIERARKAGIKTVTVEREKPARNEFDSEILKILDEDKIDLVVLAGFLRVLGERITAKYKDKIINIHPSLIPSFCGRGYYGLRVHEAALDYGVKLTGATVHFVNNEIDGGKIILQKAVTVKEGDTAETLQKRVMRTAEWKILPRAVAMFCRGELRQEQT
ncbi:MAG: phosphoribosylglycinamide formyltransferase [Treponema sp.]|nr:phosphoribosylglycinamide formyltransferase [Treponema sp.]